MRKIPSLKTDIHSSLRRRQTAQQRRRRSVVEGLEPRAMLSAVPAHVVIVMEENHDYSQIIGPTGSAAQMNAPYINSLASQGALMTNSTAITHPSEPNYLDLFSGSDQGISGDPVPTNLPFTTPNLGAALLQTGHTFVSYAETLPYPGFDAVDAASQGNFGNYARRHNPAVNWTDPANNPNGKLANNILPTSVNQPFTSFPTDFNQLPTVSLVVPNVADDMHDDPSPTGIQKGDTWLQTNLGAYAQWAQKNNSLLIVTFDENDSSAGNHIATIFDGQMVKPGQYNEAINHFNVLRTVEDMYGLTPTGTGASAASSITDVFSAPALSATGTPVTSTLGGTFTGQLATFIDTVDPNDNDPFDYSATIDWGDGTTTQGTVAGSGGAAGFSVTGSHSYANEGIHTATLTITDMNDSATATLNPVVTADYSLSATASTVSVAQGATFNGAVATFTDLDVAGPASEFTATVNWGDTSTATSASIVAADGMFSVVGSHVYAQAGTDPLTITIKDVGGATATLTSQASVAVPSTPHSVYVAAVYQDVLGRAPDMGGLQYWTHLLDTGAAISSVAAAIGHSAEYYGNFVIKPDYLKLL
ncbi:MAG TPA: alkaline phosphatase family protein, partial [Pirellulales bacterium]|nr:alkaline phosphatase family protein [Pirellulales bacterium]